MPNETSSQAALKERKRRERVQETAEMARALIRDAMQWKEDDAAAFHLASVLVEGRHPRMLAAVWRETQYLCPKTAYGARAAKVVRLANDALAKDMVSR